MEPTTCPACGATAAADATTCSACGHALAPAAPEPEVEYLLPEPTAGSGPKPGNGRTIALIALVAVVVLALAGTGLFLVLKKSDEDRVEDALRTYVTAVDEGDCATLTDVIELDGVSDKDLKAQCEEAGAADEVTVHDVAISKVEVTDGGTKASARLKVTYTDDDGRDSSTETVLLTKNDGDWEITGFEE